MQQVHRLFWICFLYQLARVVGPHVDARASTEVLASDFRTLQEYLDYMCNLKFQELCNTGNQQFCDSNLKSVLRKGVGIAHQKTKEYRCYATTAVAGDKVDRGTNGVLCLDNCGYDIPCFGSVKRDSGAFHASYSADAKKWISSGMPQFCSPSQAALNKQCSNVAGGSVARSTDVGKKAPVACIQTEALLFSNTGLCFNSCGRTSPCPGNSDSGHSSGELTRHLSDDTKESILNSIPPQCNKNQICIPKGGQIAICEEEESTLVYDAEHTLQTFLDKSCQLAVQAECKSRDAEICSATHIVARMGRGKTDSTVRWRCFDETSIQRNVSPNSVKCIENCGKAIPCSGYINPETIVELKVDLQSWIQKGKGLFCSLYQQAMQDACDRMTKKETVARKGRGHANQNDRVWRCFYPESLNFDIKGQCLDNCGRLIPCSGGRAETPDKTARLHESMLENMADDVYHSVKAPCSHSETCIASLVNPPGCSSGGTEENVTTGTMTSVDAIEEGERISGYISSREMRVEIGRCFSVTIDMVAGKMSVGKGAAATEVSLKHGSLPYFLTLKRQGFELRLILRYSLNPEEENSLFLVQKDANCMTSNKINFFGRFESAIDRSGSRSISQVTS